jgi:hypothetical protein
MDDGRLMEFLHRFGENFGATGAAGHALISECLGRSARTSASPGEVTTPAAGLGLLSPGSALGTVTFS